MSESENAASTEKSARRRILIAFTGAGHAAEAMAHLVGELERRGHEVELVSYGGLAAETARNLADKGMRGLRAALRTVTRSSGGEGDEALVEQGQGHKLDAIVATHVDLARAVRRAAGERTARLGLLADLDWEPAWTDAGFDGLVVPHPVFRELALRRGYPEAALLQGGVPLARSFSRELDVAAIRKRFAIDDAQGPVVMVVADGVEPTLLERLVFQLSLVDRPIQPIFYVGADRAASDALRRAAGEYGVLARLFGHVDNLEEYYAASDLVLASVAHPLIYSLLALDKPLVLLDADAATKPVAAFLEDEGAAVTVPDILRLGAEIDALLGSPQELDRLRQGARTVVDQLGVVRIADAIEQGIARRDELRALRTPPAEREEESRREAFGGGGAFEVIGTPPPAPAPVAPPPAPPAPAAAATSAPTADAAEAPPGSVWSQPARELGTADRIASSAQAFESHHSRRLTRAEAQEEMAALILMERDVEKRLADATRYVSQWEARLDLARQAGEPELAREAERFLANYRREETALLREMDRIRDQKDKLRRAVHGPGGGGRAPGAAAPGAGAPDTGRGAELEGRFRSMELERDLDRLKGRLRDEFGDE